VCYRQGDPVTSHAKATADRRAVALGTALADLRSNPRITDAAATPLFSADECVEIVDSCDDSAWEDRRVWAQERSGSGAALSGLMQPVPGGNSGWIAARIAEKVAQVNEEIFGFRILGLEDPVRVLCYRGDTHEDYVQDHVDVTPTHPLRKLTFSVLVSDPASFEGGELAFPIGPFADAHVAGMLTVFPSFLLHRITPVTSGRRYAVVGLVLGPTFI
jgi:PKHD-type hydroxylase